MSFTVRGAAAGGAGPQGAYETVLWAAASTPR